MKTPIKLLTVLILAIAILAQSSGASAGGGQSFNFKGKSAVAWFWSLDDSGCIATDVYLFGSEAVIRNAPGKPSSAAQSYVYISQYDLCNDVALLSAGGDAWAPNAGFAVDKKLNSASVHTVITVFDEISQSFFDVAVDMTWTASGPETKIRQQTHFKSPGCHFKDRRNGTMRYAEASGTVSDGVTNYTPSPSFYGETASLKSGTIVKGCV